MSKITGEQVAHMVCGNYNNGPVGKTDAIMALIDQREAEFQELVDAAVAWSKWHRGYGSTTDEQKALHAAAKPFLPPPSPHKQLADRLYRMTKSLEDLNNPQSKAELREIVAEIEKLGEHDDM